MQAVYLTDESKSLLGQFTIAIHQRRIDVVRTLLDSPLADFLLDMGEGIVPEEIYGTYSRDGLYTLLEHAIRSNNREMAEVFLRKGADVSIYVGRLMDSYVMRDMRDNKMDWVKLLIDNGAKLVRFFFVI